MHARRGFAVVAAIGPSITDPSVGIGMIFDKNRYGLDNDTGEFGARCLTSVPVDTNTVWLVTKFDSLPATNISGSILLPIPSPT